MNEERKRPVRVLSRDELLALFGKPRFPTNEEVRQDMANTFGIIKVEEPDDTTGGNESDG